jgi:hypothetical protein
MATKIARKCSVCRIPGHTKRTCDSAVKPMRKSNPESFKPRVIVRVKKDATQSPHVVDLRTEERTESWEKINAFTEKTKETKVVRKQVDLSRFVFQYNKNEAAKWRKTMDSVKGKIRVSQEPSQPFLSTQSRFLEFFKQYRDRAEVRPVVFRGREKGQVTPVRKFFYFHKFSFTAIALILAIIIPVPAIGYVQHLKDVNNVVVEQSTSGFLALQASTVSALSSNIIQAQIDLTSALDSFATANSLVEKEYHLLTSVARLIPVVGSHITSRQQLLLAGHHLALGNTYLVKGISEAQANEGVPMTDRFTVIKRHLQSALPQYQEALLALNQVEVAAVPIEYQQVFKDFRLLYATFIDDISDIVEFSNAINTIFGAEGFKRYLLVFQNHHELRPTGGFIGSFAVLDVQKGKIVGIDVPGGGSYDLKGQLTEFLKPPLPLQLLNERWEFQDANWFPDFAASADKLAWFYEKSRGQTIDGVIAINASVLEDLLGVLGPIENEDFNLVLDHENVLQSLQYQVEVAFDKEENRPKAAIASLFDQLLALLKDADAVNALQLLTLAHSSASEKDIQVYMRDENVQKALQNFGWTGEIIETNTDQDYVMAVHSNIQGQKSDAKIEQEISHQAHIQNDGSVINTVHITRTHKGKAGEQFYGTANIGYLRLYVPEGAELLEAGGFAFPPEEAFRVPLEWAVYDTHLLAYEKDYGVHYKTGTKIVNEFGKTSFGNWIITGPGETSEVYFVYKLPFSVSMGESSESNVDKWQSVFDTESETKLSRYTLVIQKQSGTESKFSSRIVYPTDWSPVWKSEEEIDLSLNGAEHNFVLSQDEVIGLVMSK